MKYVLVIPDGCADEPQQSLGGKTPVEAARTPGMDAEAQQGVLGLAETVPESMPSGSDVGTMSLFGYDPLKYHTGRAPLEAAAQGIELGADDWAIRCNLVTIIDGVMKSFTAEQIGDADARGLIELLQRDLCGDTRWKFHAGVSYRNLLLDRSRGTAAPYTAETLTIPPHDITDQPVEKFLPAGPGSADLRKLMDRSRELFAEAEVNQQRQQRGEPPATQIWLWGQGSRPALVPFQERFGLSGAVITAVDLLRGLGRLLGWEIITVPGATGYLDTDYAAKGAYAIDAVSQHDFVVVHVEASDEASHEGNTAAKIEALEQIDEHIVRPVHEALKQQPDGYRLLISPDHPTFLRTRTHSHGAVPFAMCGTGLAADSARTYGETEASGTSLRIRGHEMLPLLFDQQK
ncbi:MAG: cofactor-independent phosphoglycerate mutase [Planctomycetaceae bacterium]|nr:cofactor-independent phosphoglycerate mutase [Planctomycetaceae bacterium]